MVITAGVDAGAYSTKAVVLSEDRRVLGRAIAITSASPAQAAEKVYAAALEQAGLTPRDVRYVVSTGFGRYMVPFRDVQVTDFVSHAQGALYHFPQTRCVLDIGAQSTRASNIEPIGRVKTFRMNSRCAAGAGAFLVRVAHYLEVPLAELAERALRAQKAQPISSVCAVLAETEIINHITSGSTEEDIIAGVMEAVANQGLILLRKAGIESELTLTGGLSMNPAMVQTLSRLAGLPVNVSANGADGGLFAGALGASILAQMRLAKLDSTAKA